jgi:PD-(D/E)XK endonuclease
MGDVDFFAVYCPETSGVYLVPIEDVPVRVHAALRVDMPRNRQKKRIRYASEYELTKVQIERQHMSPQLNLGGQA